MIFSFISRFSWLFTILLPLRKFNKRPCGLKTIRFMLTPSAMANILINTFNSYLALEFFCSLSFFQVWVILVKILPLKNHLHNFCFMVLLGIVEVVALCCSGHPESLATQLNQLGLVCQEKIQFLINSIIFGPQVFISQILHISIDLLDFFVLLLLDLSTR